jgi:hypothetical protein
LAFAGTGMKLKNITFSKITHAQKAKKPNFFLFVEYRSNTSAAIL